MGTRRNFQRKTNGTESPLHVLPVASKLIDYTLELTDNTKHFPKKVRFSIVNRIQDRVLAIRDDLVDANEIFPILDEQDKIDRLKLQRRALTGCKKLLYLSIISKQFLDLTLCNSANGGKACIYGLFRHLLYGRTIRI